MQMNEGLASKFPDPSLEHSLVLPLITAHVHSTTGGYVFIGLCLFRGGTPASGPRSLSSLWCQVLNWVPSQAGTRTGVPLPQPGPGKGYPLPPIQDQDTVSPSLQKGPGTRGWKGTWDQRLGYHPRIAVLANCSQP